MLGDESYARLLENQRMGTNSAPEPELSDGKELPANGIAISDGNRLKG